MDISLPWLLSKYRVTLTLASAEGHKNDGERMSLPKAFVISFYATSRSQKTYYLEFTRKTFLGTWPHNLSRILSASEKQELLRDQGKIGS